MQRQPKAGPPVARMWWVAVLTGAAILAGWLREPSQTGTTRAYGSSPVETDSMARCGHDFFVRVPKDSAQTDTLFLQVPVAGRRTNIPELHDCQRLLDGASSAYGPLVGVWASEALDHLADSLDALRASTGRAMAIAAAETYNWDSTYAPLGIHPHFDCLYVLRAGEQGARTWMAWMVPVGYNGSQCLDNLDSMRAEVVGMRLGMEPLPHALSGPDINPSARWDWSEHPAHQYIGLKCGIQWCEVYNPAGFTSAPAMSAGGVPPGLIPTILGFTILPGHLRRVFEVKGWYDEQRLAPARGVPHRATTIAGRVFADPRLVDYTGASFTAHVWLPSAYVQLQGPRSDLADYQSKYGFMPGWNIIWLCSGERAVCFRGGYARIAGHAPVAAPPYCLTSVPPGARWWGVSFPHGGAGPGKAMCVTRREFPGGGGLVGAVRWRWRENDDSIWVSCIRGCCEMET